MRAARSSHERSPKLLRLSTIERFEIVDLLSARRGSDNTWVKDLADLVLTIDYSLEQAALDRGAHR